MRVIAPERGARWPQAMTELVEVLVVLFPTAIRTSIDPRYHRRSLARATRAAGIGDEWTPHELRHTYASLLSDAGVSMERIADRWGTLLRKAMYRRIRKVLMALVVGLCS